MSSGTEFSFSSYLLRTSLRSYPSDGSPHGTVTPPHASVEPVYRSPVSLQMPSAHSSYQNSSPSSFAMVQGGVPGSSYSSPDYPDSRAALQPDPQARPQPQVNVVGVHVLPGSPRSLHRTVATNTPPSPGFGRRAVNPGMSGAPGSPGLGRHAVVAHGNLVASPGSPSLARHQTTAVPPGSPLYGYPSPDERRPTLSRQSSSSGYQPPSTPSFPVSPAYYPGTSTPHSSSPDSAAYHQSSPTPQPALPEKRRMSAGDRSNSLPNYATVNGKASSPLSSGMSSPSGGSAVTFHTLPDFSKFSMPGKGYPWSFLCPPALPRALFPPPPHRQVGKWLQLCPDLPLLPIHTPAAPAWAISCAFWQIQTGKALTRHCCYKQRPELCAGRSKHPEAVFLCCGDALTSWPRSQQALPC